MPRALYVGENAGSHLYLPHLGYVRVLRRFGWTVDEISLADAPEADITPYDLILWNGAIPERILAAVRPSVQTLVAMNGAGDDLSHYVRHPGRIALATTSLTYFDECRTPFRRRYLNPRRMLSRQYYYLLHYARRFHHFAGPRFWREQGIRLLYLPFGSDWEVFHPTGATADLHWSFVGQMRERPLVQWLARESDRRGIPYALHSPETRNPIDPSRLNDLYNRTKVGLNEHHQLHFGRELNERAFDLGMAGRMQLSDMGWLGARELGPFADFYSGNVADARDFGRALATLVSPPEGPDPATIHAHFRRHHSFEARLAALSGALGVDLSLGRMTVAHGQVEFDGVTHVPMAM